MFTAREFLEATPHPPATTATTTTSAAYDQPPPGAPALPPAFYARIAAVPLLLSPALRLAPPPQFPQDLHPLPLDLAPYMIYPFSLERHVLHPDPAQGGPLVEDDPLEMLHAARDYLEERRAQVERERKAALQRIAPGWAELEGRGGVLEPKRKLQLQQQQLADTAAQPGSAAAEDDLDDLAAQMAALDASTRAAAQSVPAPVVSAPLPASSAAASTAPPTSSLIPPPPAAATIHSSTPGLPGFDFSTPPPSSASQSSPLL
ncbi:hypothetical protein OC842_006748 [Tilletia horrida]|uniref:Uncharacterized protein n=1 Tax=Tilletia horrida TaxID=155126 RepID=A0AAN6G7A3_9BASI|nr:hypothetical protein OC842_006748 [Tilletia horrida]